MASSAVVGILRALLVADTAEFDQAMKRAEDSAKEWSKSLKKIGADAEKVGRTLTVGITAPLVAIGAGAAKLAIDFESSFAGVRKTVDASEAEFKQLETQFRNLAKQIPVDVNELNKLGEAAGALGIPKEKIAGFVEVMAGLGTATNLSSEEAANSIARIQNIFGAAGVDTDRFASTLVGLGNAGASTEKEIVEMAARIAGAGHTVRLTQAQVLAFSSSLASVGINAEAGGSAMSRVLLKMNDAVDKGGEALKGFAKVAGVEMGKFKTLFQQDAAQAVTMFIEGLGKMQAAGGNLSATMEPLIGKNIILKDTLIRLAGAGELVRKDQDNANTLWRENNALQEETRKRYETTAAQLQILWQRLKDVGITLGQALMPAIKSLSGMLEGAIPLLDGLVQAFTSLPKGIQTTIIAFGGLLAAAGPALMLFGSMSTGLGNLVGVFAKNTDGVSKFGTALMWLAANPVVLIIAGLAALAGVIYLVATAETELEKAIRTNAKGFRDETAAMETTLQTYDELKGKTNLTKEEVVKLDDATRKLAEGSGLTIDAFRAQARESDDVTRSYREQLGAHKDLLALETEEARKKFAAAEAQAARTKAARDLTLQGKGKTPTVEGLVVGAIAGSAVATTIGGPLFREETGLERIEASRRLQAQLVEETKKTDELRAAYYALAGITKESGAQDVSRAAAMRQSTGATQANTAATGANTDGKKTAKTAEEKYADSIEKTARAMSKAGVADEIKKMNDQVKAAIKFGGLEEEALDKLVKQIDEWIVKGYDVGPMLSEMHRQYILLHGSMIPIKDTTKDLIRQQPELMAAFRATGDFYANLSDRLTHFSKLVQTGPGAANRLIEKFSTFSIDAEDLFPPIPPTFWQQKTAGLREAFLGDSGVFADMTAGFTDVFAAWMSGTQSFADGFESVWRGLFSTVVNIWKDLLNTFINQFLKGMLGALMGQQGAWGKAFGGMISSFGQSAATTAAGTAGTTAAGAGTGAAGAGGMAIPAAAVGGAVAGAGVGYAVGNYVGYKTGSTTKGVLAGAGAGASTGAIVGSVIPGAGTVVGLIVGGVVGAIAGAYGAKKAGKDINKMRDAYLQQQGGDDALEKRLGDLGRSDLWKPFAFGERNIDSFKQALGNIQEVIQAADKKAADLKAGFDRLGGAITAFGGYAPAEIRKLVAPLLQSKDLTAEMRRSLEGFAADPSWQTVATRAQDLGIDLAAMGPKLNEARISDIALGYLRDLTMFEDQGFDVVGMLHGMSDELSTLWQEAQKTGQKLPESLRPYMQRLVEMGELVDENGVKVEGLTDEMFKEVEDKGLTDVVDVLQEIKDLLARQLPSAAEQGAAGVRDAYSRQPVVIPFRYEQQGGAPGGPGTAQPRSDGDDNPPPGTGLQGGTHGQYVDWGSGTAVTLHGRERVVPEGELVGGGAGAPIQITVISTLDGREVARNQVRHIPRALQLAGL